MKHGLGDSIMIYVCIFHLWYSTNTSWWILFCIFIASWFINVYESFILKKIADLVIKLNLSPSKSESVDK